MKKVRIVLALIFFSLVVVIVLSGALKKKRKKGQFFCTKEQIINNAAHFAEMKKSSGAECSTSQWIEKIYATDTNPAKILINIGANKGYRLVEFYDIWAPWLGMNSRSLYRLLLEKDVELPCGACGDCNFVKNFDRLKFTDQNRGTIPTSYAIDANLRTFNLLMEIRDYFKAFNFMKVYHLAGHNKDGKIGFQDCNKASEGCEIDDKATVFVNATTIDAFFEREGISRADFVLIDTEGHDPLVIQGAKKTLSEERISCIEFEYHGKGKWKEFQLQNVVAELSEDFDFDCFLMGKPHLYLLTNCWHPAYEFHDWSDVVCVHRSKKDWRNVLFSLTYF